MPLSPWTPRKLRSSYGRSTLCRLSLFWSHAGQLRLQPGPTEKRGNPREMQGLFDENVTRHRVFLSTFISLASSHVLNSSQVNSLAGSFILAQTSTSQQHLVTAHCSKSSSLCWPYTTRMPSWPNSAAKARKRFHLKEETPSNSHSTSTYELLWITQITKHWNTVTFSWWR